MWQICECTPSRCTNSAGGPREEHWVFYYDTGETVIEKYMLSLHWSLTQFTPAGDYGSVVPIASCWLDGSVADCRH